MTTKADYTAEEWNSIMQSPMAAAMVVMFASPSNPVGLAQETFAVSKMLAENVGKPSGVGLIDAVSEQLKDAEGRKAAQPPWPEAGADLAALKGRALDTLRQLNDLLAAKAPVDEASSFRKWILDTAQRVASAAKEGGFLGIGGTPISAEETAAIAEVERTLGTVGASSKQ
ncbi:MAG: hypothetical protein ABIV47_25320 [Roseiflexaceae bacterium]